MRFLRQRSSVASRPRNATADGLLGSGAAGAGGQWNTAAIAGMQPQYVDLMDEINSDVNTIKGKSALELCPALGCCVNFRATSGFFPASLRLQVDLQQHGHNIVSLQLTSSRACTMPDSRFSLTRHRFVPAQCAAC